MLVSSDRRERCLEGKPSATKNDDLKTAHEVVILDPTAHEAQELYVALTRGSKSVTVVSESSTLPPVSTDKYQEKQIFAADAAVRP